MTTVISPPASATPDACASAPARGASQSPSLDRLADALEQVFRACPELPVLAIRWMHLKHPFHEVQRQLLQADASDAAANIERSEMGRWSASAWIRPMLLRRLAQCVVYALYTSCRLLPLRLVFRRRIALLKRERFDVIAKTCCYWPGRPVEAADFYFGDLSQRLARRGIRMLLLCGNLVGGSRRAFANAHLTQPPQARFPEAALVPPFTSLKLLVAQLMTCVRLRRAARRMRDPLVKRAALLASQDCLAPDTTRAALYFWIGRDVASAWRAKAVVTLYEGHAWERCFSWGIKQAHPASRVVGYQHTTMFPECLSQFRPPLVHRDLLPDVVLCLGDVTRELMREGHERYGARMIRFGSFRYRTVPVSRPPDPSRRTVLVTPEGLMPEVKALFAFACVCAKRMPSYTFILRCHPESPMAEVRQLLAPHLSTTPNLIFSEGRPIEADFARASIVLYRGSSSVIYAVLQGLLPIYLHVPMLDERDPLFQLAVWRQRCSTVEEFQSQLMEYERAPAREREASWSDASAYAAKYTGPVTDEHITALLDAIPLCPSRCQA